MWLKDKIFGFLFGTLQDAYYNHRYNSYRKKYKIALKADFKGTDIRLYGDGQISISNGSYIGSYSTIQSIKGKVVEIGKNVQISHNVRMYTSTDLVDQDFANATNRIQKSGNIVIGNGVWIGVNVYIGPGVTIGNNSIVGANSVVTKDIPSNSINGGVPARLIRYKKQF